MDMHVMSHWLCHACQVEGRDAEVEPMCWNCGGAVTVTARPTVRPDLRSDAA